MWNPNSTGFPWFVCAGADLLKSKVLHYTDTTTAMHTLCTSRIQSAVSRIVINFGQELNSRRRERRIRLHEKFSELKESFEMK